jgi:outer membrane lipoprotein SlyB
MHNMKTLALSLGLSAAALLLAGCETPYGTPDRTGTGALAGAGVGAASGALIGSASGNAAAGALIGGAVGTVGGALIGHSMDQQEAERLRAQAPQTYVRVEQNQPLMVADVRAMAQAQVGDDVIISQIQNSRTVYHLSASDIIDLRNSGVSERVVQFMINTPSLAASYSQQSPVVQEAPPAAPPETYVASPGPEYVWVDGQWIWNGRWVWMGGHWVYPPYRSAVWVHGYWVRGPYGWHWVPGRWR